MSNEETRNNSSNEEKNISNIKDHFRKCPDIKTFRNTAGMPFELFPLNERQAFFDNSKREYQLIFNQAFHETLRKECPYFYAIARVKPLSFENLNEQGIHFASIFHGDFDDLRIVQSIEQAARSKATLLGKIIKTHLFEFGLQAIENIVQVEYPKESILKKAIKYRSEIAIMQLGDVVITDGGAECSPRIIWQAFWKYRAMVQEDVLV